MTIFASTTAAALMLAQYGYGMAPPTPPPSSYQPTETASGGLDTAPFVELQRKCLNDAVAQSATAAQDVKQKRFDSCVALHEAMARHATAKLSEKEAASVKRQLDRALKGLEQSYANKLGVTIAGRPE